ncbi:MAG: CsbD family protein [Methylohalobius sp. ZOD2]
MNWEQIKGNWNQFKGEAKKNWADLTDDDLDRIEGQRDKFIGVLQERYGIAKDEAEKQVDSFFSKL